MPLSLLEAMSYGNCCVVSDIPECADVVQNHAAVFPKADVAQLKKCLQLLCDEPQKVESYKAGAADFICDKYSWDDVVQKTLALYEGEKK
jgi:glycosyltransferase involved in cell wall biosynthesis